ncbi:MAG TPA: hypothetical protein VJA66_05335 [Thermoanaerobaculia bacterium]
MTVTRRQTIFIALLCLFAPFAAALPEKSAPLEVTYYYLPG